MASDEHIESRMALQSVLHTGKHPWDPHTPSYSPLLPQKIRPYPSFEGWYTRITDPNKGLSLGLILATNYATEESQVTMLICPGPDSDLGNMKAGHTYALAYKTKNARFNSLSTTEANTEPDGFQWEAPGIAHVKMEPHQTFLDVTIENFHLNAHLDHEVLWSAGDSQKGPEGWAGKIPILPTHWYIYSLGSVTQYSLSNSLIAKELIGTGFGHQEKNWGETFPNGHIWLQAQSSDNSSQVVCAGAYFKISKLLETPFIFAMGYRSQKQQIDMRTNDIGTYFKDIDINISPSDGVFSVTAVGPSHSVKIFARAAFETFSNPILAPIGKLDWEPACRESFSAKIEVQVYKHRVWGIADETLVEQQTFANGGLEFGEDLMQEAFQSNSVKKG